MKKAIEITFDIKPSQWDLRGSVYLWEYLNASLLEKEKPLNPEDFKTALIREFNEFIMNFGRLEVPSEFIVHFETFPQDGMSGGRITLFWWKNVAIPSLCENYEVAYRRICGE